MDKKRQRDETLAETLLEQAKKGLLLSRDVLMHMTTFLDWEALRNFCNVNDEMRKFCSANQVWKRKFVRQVSLLPPQSQLLSYITREQWIKYWDFLAESRCPSLDILFAAFVTLFDNGAGSGDKNLRENILVLRNAAFQFNLTFQDTREKAKPHFYGAYFSNDIEERIGFFAPVVVGCFVRKKHGNNLVLIYRQEDASEIERLMYILRWEMIFDYDALDYMTVAIKPLDAVTVIYKFFEFGYLPLRSNFKTVTSSIEPICAHCTSPTPLTVCGACEAVPYCGQKCANAHWEKHNCTK